MKVILESAESVVMRDMFSFLSVAFVLLFSTSCAQNKISDHDTAKAPMLHHVTKTANNFTQTPILIVKREKTPRAIAGEYDHWRAATDKEVLNANCRNKIPKTTKEILSYYAKKPHHPGYEPDGVLEFKGIKFVNERPELVFAVSKLLLPAVDQSLEVRLPNDLKKHFKIADSCQLALCAVRKIFGENVGPQMLFLMAEFDINTSPYSYANTSLFKFDELQDVISTLELLNPTEHPFDSNQKLAKFLRGFTLAGYREQNQDDAVTEVVANASIELFDPWTERESGTRQYTLYHEIAHLYSEHLFSSFDESNTWLEISGWKPEDIRNYKTPDINNTKPVKSISIYGDTNPLEDFAESLSSYRFKPEALKKADSVKYEFIKYYIFGGKEFTKNIFCAENLKPSSLQQKIRSEFKPNDADLKIISSACKATFYQSVFNRLPVSYFHKCVDFESILLWQKKYSNNPELLPQTLFNKKLRTSNIKFPEIAKALQVKLRDEVADWALSSVFIADMGTDSFTSNEEYCSLISEQFNSIYPDLGFSMLLERKDYARLLGVTPKKDVLRSMCLTLVSGYIVPKQPTAFDLKEWLRLFGLATNGSVAPEIDRITKKSLQAYIDRQFKF